MNNVTLLNRMNHIKIETPFIRMSKYDELLIGQELKVPYEDTWTCYNPINNNNEILACGKCPSCSERLMNFDKLGIKDSLKYV
jgi:7-cyano-7-deazaguanine synthase